MCLHDPFSIFPRRIGECFLGEMTIEQIRPYLIRALNQEKDLKRKVRLAEAAAYYAKRSILKKAKKICKECLIEVFEIEVVKKEISFTIGKCDICGEEKKETADKSTCGFRE